MDINTPNTQPTQTPEPTQSAQKPQPVTPPPDSKQHGLPIRITMLLLVIAFIGGLLLAAWYFQMQFQKMSSPKPSIHTAIPETRVLVVGSDATAPPMESINKQGSLVGYDIDLGYRLANEMGMKVEFKNVIWDDIFTSLLNKKIDMIISSVTITDERKQKYAFSDPYINAGQVIVSRKDNPISTTAGLKGKKISVQKGTTNEKEAMKYTDPKLIVSYDNFIDAAKAASDGTTDATISDLTLAKGYVDQYNNLKITSDPFTNEYYGIVLRKEDTQLLKKVNDAVNVLNVKGILTDLKQKWLE